MKNIQLFHLTPSGTFLYSDNGHFKQGTLQGIRFNNSILSRHVVKPYLTSISCAISKNSNGLRYHNMEFYKQMLRLNAAKINLVELESTKVFNKQQKDQLKQVQVDMEKIEQINKQIADYGADRKSLQDLFRKTKKIEGHIQYLKEDIVLNFQQEGVTHYVPIKLRNIDHYFQLIENLNLADFILNKSKISVDLVNCKYNLNKRQYEILGILPQQIEKLILSQGWGTVSLNNLIFIKPTTMAQYRKIQQQAKVSHKGIFSKPFQILSLIYTKNNLVAVVEEVIQGYVFKLRTKNNDIMKVELAKIYCPIQNEPGAFTCRQFARKNLIGKDVNVFLTKDEGLNILGSIVRFSDNKDIETLMIENGCGFVKDQLKGTMFYAKLESLEKKAKQARKGIHNEKNIGVQFYEDFTQPHSKKQKLEKKNAIQGKQRFLFQCQAGEEGVIEKCIDAVTYVIRIDSAKKLIKVRLDGVNKLNANPRLTEVQELQKTIQTYCLRNFNQRTVILELVQYNQVTNSFIGVIRLCSKSKQKAQISLQELLLRQGLVVLDNSELIEDKWMESQNYAEGKGVNIWRQNLRHFVHRDMFEDLPKQFVGKFSWLEDGELAYVQPNSSVQKLDKVFNALSNPQILKPVPAQDLVPGYLCAAEYQGQLYRAKIVSVDKAVNVRFIDWGNKQSVPAANLRQIPLQLQYIPPLCCEIILDLVRKLKVLNPQHMQNLRDFAMESEQLRFVKSENGMVNVYNKGEHINSNLILQGYVKADLTKITEKTQKQYFKQEMDKLRKQFVGVWDTEDNDSDIQDKNDKYAAI